jgi:hypothetical protein
MLARYLKFTGDTNILARAIPLAEVGFFRGSSSRLLNLSIERVEMVV